jgi:GNAT superfamily N-acetyltransferase
VSDKGQERFVAVSRYRTDPVTLDCECVVCVRDEARHEGLESLLMKHLIEVARARGIRSMALSASASRPHVQHLADVLGFTTEGAAGDSGLRAHKLRL